MGEMERAYIRSRQREGIDAAQRRGKHLGRPRLQVDERFAPLYQQVREGKLSAAMAMRKLGMAKTTWYKIVKRFEKENNHEKY
jgi:DNA invertase Pin-like site-specific DNA recombinase